MEELLSSGEAVEESTDREGKKKMENLRQRKKREIYRNKKSNTTLAANVF